MNLTDTHAHLYWDSLKKDLDNILQRAKDTGVSYIINIGVDVATSKKATEQVGELNKKYGPEITFYSSIGIHPEEAQKYTDQEKLEIDIQQLEQIYRSAPQTIVAVGECGLDFLLDWVPDEKSKKLQRQLFQAQIDLAKKLDLPLLVHCRDDRSQNSENSEAWTEVIEMTKSHFGIYHCYSGLPQTTNHLLQSTCFLVSFAGNLTYPKNEYLREAAKQIPLDRITLETDCPFLPPQSKRGQKNEPGYILETARVLADLKNISLEDLSLQTTTNAKRLLKIA